MRIPTITMIEPLGLCIEVIMFRRRYTIPRTLGDVGLVVTARASQSKQEKATAIKQKYNEFYKLAFDDIVAQYKAAGYPMKVKAGFFGKKVTIPIPYGEIASQAAAFANDNATKVVEQEEVNRVAEEKALIQEQTITEIGKKRDEQTLFKMPEGIKAITAGGSLVVDVGPATTNSTFPVVPVVKQAQVTVQNVAPVAQPQKPQPLVYKFSAPSK